MANKLITLTNDFHETEVHLRAKVVPTRVPGLAGLELSAGQVRRARRTLCGIPDCTCGGSLGERPSADIIDGPRYDDGSITLVDEEVA